LSRVFHDNCRKNDLMSRARRGWIIGLGIAVGLVGVLWLGTVAVFDAYKVPSASMEPAVDPGDRILVRTVRFAAGRGDKVVYRALPGQPVSARISRVVGLAGERIEARDGQVRIDGEVLDERYLPDGTLTDGFRPVTVPAGHVFVISDNRGNARDSRLDGPLDEDRIIGTVAFVGLPLDRILFGAAVVLGVGLLVVALRGRGSATVPSH
jgi:signal peptidase I